MDAVKFIEERNRMCGTMSEVWGVDAAQIVKTTEEWSAAHPRKTRQSVFLEQHPQAHIDEDGVLWICPSMIVRSHRRDGGGCANSPEKCPVRVLSNCGSGLMWRRKTMAECIDKEAFKKSVEERYCKPCKAEKKDHNGCWCRACWVDDMLDEVECFQPADVALVVHGRWEPCFDENCRCRWGFGKCSNCGQEYYAHAINYYKYCPNCGAKMDGRE
nr:MAG TPA: DNA-directed RNA polymerase [Caudoviricetes sp.]